jgi:hypothetical protein
MKFKKLSSTGIVHHFLLPLIIIGVGIFGAYEIVASHADSCSDGASNASSDTGEPSGGASNPTSPGNCGAGQRWVLMNYETSWFKHGYQDRTTNYGYADPEWGNYFKDPTVMDDMLSKTDVMHFWPQAIVDNDDNHWFENLLPELKKYHVKIAIYGGYIQKDSSNPNCSGSVAAQNDLNNYIAKIRAKGALVSYIVVDGFPRNLLLDPARDNEPVGCKKTVDQAVPELASYMQTIHASYPRIKIGLDVNFAQWAYNWNGTPYSYFGLPVPLTDYKSILEKMVTDTTNKGEKIAFVQVDNPYDYITDEHSSSWHTPSDVGYKGVDWLARLLDLEKEVKSKGIRFGMMYNTSEDDLLNQDNSFSMDTPAADKKFHDDTVAFAKLYKSRGGKPNQTVFASWYPRGPSKLLPESAANTFANDYKDLLASFKDSSAPQKRVPPTVKPPSLNPLYRLKNKEGYYFYTIYATEKESAIRDYGYTDDGIAFNTLPEKTTSTVPVFRLTGPQANRLFTIYESERDDAVKKYGYSYDGVAFYAYPTATRTSVPVYRLETKTGHYYTSTISERDALIASGAINSGIAFYVPNK